MVFLGKKMKLRRKYGLSIWTPELKEIWKEKQMADMEYLNHTSVEKYQENKQKKKVTIRKVRKAQQECCNKYISTIEDDVHGK